MPSDVLITPASSKIDFTDGSNATKRLNISGTAFSFNSNLNVLSSTSLSSAFKAEGVNGTLFEVTDDLSNSLMSVNTIGGLPVFEVFANNSIIGGQYGANDFVISGNKIGLGYANPVNKLSVSGSVSIGSSYNVAAPSNGLIVQGNVGIGTVSPTNGTLQVYNASGNTLSLQKAAGGAALAMGSETTVYALIESVNSGGIKFYTGNGSQTERWTITAAGILQSNNAQTIQTSTGNLTLATAAGNGHIILSPHGTGNVGIGVTSPRVLLDLAKTNNVGQVLLLGEVGANIRVGFGLAPSNAGMRIFSLNHITDGLIEFGGISSSDGSTWTRNHRLGLAGANSFFNEQGGNVGIGTISPGAKLDVNGSTRLGGIIYNESVQTDDFNYFNLQPYVESETLSTILTFGGTAPTFVTLTNTASPFSKVLSVSAYGEALMSDYIPVQAGETIYGEIWTYRATGAAGTAGVIYCGVQRYDKDKKMIDGNGGLNTSPSGYFIASNQTIPSNSTWTKYSGTLVLPTSHTVYNTSDGGPVRYIRPYIIYNYTAGTILTYIGGWKIRKVQLTRDLGPVSINGNVGIGSDISSYSRLLLSTTSTTPTLNSTNPVDVSLIISNSDVAYGTMFATYGDGKGALQQRRTDAATYYDFSLQPHGGNIGIGTLSTTQKLSVTNTLSITNTAGVQYLLMGNQDSSGANNPAIIKSENGAFSFGGGTSWGSSGGIFTSTMFLSDAGNVGIGTTSPSNRLDSAINIASSDYLGDANVYALAIKNYDATAGNAVGMTFGHGGYSYTNFVASIRTGTGANPKGDLVFGGRPADGSTFTENMRLKAGGNVGIGTANPGTSLEIYATPATSTTLRQMLIINTDFASASGTGFGGSIVFRGRTAGNLLRDNAQITAYNEDIGDNGYALGFFTRPSDGGGLQQRLTILRGGNVGIATLSPANKLAVLGSVSIGSGYNTAAPTNGLLVEGSIGAGTTSPDLKVHIDAANAYPASSGTTPNGYLTLRAKTAGGTHGMYLGVANASPYGSWIQCSDSGNLATNYPLLLNPNGGSVGIGLTNPSYKLDVGAVGSGSISVRLTPGYERVRYYGFDLLGYNDGNLWMMGNNPTNTLLLSNNWDWDYQIAISYTPSTIGAAGGSLEIGQMTKNNANFTHGNTRFYTNGIERLRIINNGNVGIGISSPAARLHVNSTTSGATLLRADGTNGTLFSVVDDLSDSLMSVNNSAGLPVLEVFADDRVVAGQYGANDFVLVNNKLGLGTNNPQYELDIVGLGTNAAVNIITRIRSSASSDTFNTGSVIAFTNTTTNVNAYSYIGSRIDLGGAGDNAQALIFATNATNTLPTEKMRIKSDGNVGIGTATPATLLQINTGTPSSATGGIQFGDDAGTRLYRSASGIVTCSGTIAATFSGNLTGNVTGNATNVTGTVAIANGGTGATTAANARTNLGATTVGANLFILPNVTTSDKFLRVNFSDNTVSALDAAAFRTAIGAGTGNGNGTVTSVGGTGTVSGLTLSGTVTTTGNLTLGGTLSVTASNFASQTANTFLSAPNGAAGVPTFRAIVAADVPTLNQNTTGNANTASLATTSDRLTTADNRTISPSEDDAYRLRFGFTSWANNNSSPYADYLHLRSYSDSSGGNDNLVMFRKDAIGMRIYQAGFGTSVAYSSFKDVAFTDQSFFIGTTSIAINRASAALTLNGVNISGTAASETFATVTGRGSSTTTQISVGTTSSGSMYTGIKSGAGYSDTVSGATFKSITDHPTGGSFAFAAYYNGAPGTGTNSFYVAANGGAYFAQGVGIGVTSPLQALHINGNIILDGTTNGYTQSTTRGIGYGSNNGAISVDGFSGMDIQSVNAPAPNNGNYSQNLRFWTHHYGTGTGATPRMFLQYNGNLGVGTVSPTAKLNVLSTSSLSSVFKTEGVNGTLFEVTDDLSNSLMSVNTIGGLPVFEVFANNSVIAGQYGQNDFVISGNKVGIGTASPVYKLNVIDNINSEPYSVAFFRNTNTSNSFGGIIVNGNNQAHIRFLTGASTWGAAGAKQWQIRTGAANNVDALSIYSWTTGSDVLYINSSGNVGINNTNPGYKLDVNGTSVFRDTVNIGPSIGTITWGSMGGGTGFGVRAESGRALSFGAGGSFDHLVINTAGRVGIGITSPSVKLAVDGEASFGDGSKLTMIGLDITSGVTPNFIKIRTKIPFTSGAADFTINIKGFRYGSAETANISICWHYYNSTFYNPAISSAGSFAPIVKLSAEDWDSSGTPKVCIVLVGPGYWPKLYVESMYSSSYNDDYADGWDWIDADATGTGNNLATLSYKSNFGNNFVMLGNGNVGIGTASPTTKLDIASTESNGIVMRFDTTTNYQAWIRPYWNSSTDSRIDFAINRASGVTPDVIMSVGYGGYVGIGTTTPATLLQIGTGTPTAATLGVQFGGDTAARIYRIGSSTIRISNNLTVGGTLTESSSIRYKENVKTIIAPILPKLNEIRPVTYNKKDNPNNIEYGIIAEELNDLFPELVNKNNNGEVESVNYSRLTVLLIKAVKELKQEIEILKNK